MENDKENRSLKINKFKLIKDKKALEALSYVAKLKSQLFDASGLISPEEYKQRYIESLYKKDKTGSETIKTSKLEKRVEVALKECGYNIVRQKHILGFFYDFYLPDENLLIEVDGSFWHPKDLDAANYKSQKKNYVKDITKNVIAKARNIDLLRVREEEIKDLDEIQLQIMLDEIIQQQLKTRNV
jgi:very-short-patch-repair endonuclease